jgi:hypothetical protein
MLLSDFLHTGVYKITQNKYHGIRIVKKITICFPTLLIDHGENRPLFKGRQTRHSFSKKEIHGIKFANILKKIILDYIDSREDQLNTGGSL